MSSRCRKGGKEELEMFPPCGTRRGRRGVDRSDTVLCLGSYQCHSTSSYPEKILALPWKSSFHDFPVTFVSNVKTKEVFDNWNYVCLFDSALYEPCSSGVGLK